MNSKLLLVGSVFSVLIAGCASKPEPAAPQASLQLAHVSYDGATCKQMAPQLVSWARQEHELSSRGNDGAAQLANVRQEKQAVRMAMKASGCF